MSDPEQTESPAPPSAPAVAALRAGQVDAAAELLAAAFFDDPLFRYLCPDEARRRRVLLHLQRTVIRLYATAGEARVIGEDDGPLGVLLRAAPGELTPPLGAFLRFLGANLLARPSVRPALPRVVGGIRMLAHVERHHLADPHWYVAVLGVAPAAQGRGVGRALLDDVFARAEADGVPVYLETTNPDNVPLYEHLGFETREELEPPGGGPPVWTMLRRP